MKQFPGRAEPSTWGPRGLATASGGGGGGSIPFWPNLGVSGSIPGCRAEQVAMRGDQLGCAAGAKELLICLFPGQLPPPRLRRLQSSPDRQEFVAMCWESSFPPAVGSPARRAQARWTGASQGEGPRGPRCGPGSCPGPEHPCPAQG